ncbi:MAG: ABC transporter ATP-binding protein [Chloroflexota bacterium]|nr:ABC transporter ATP-binding protein [Chloroflexota bacterium]
MGMRQTYVDTSNLSGRTVAGTLRRLLYYVGLHRRHIGIAFAALSIASLLNMVPPWALKIAIDDFIPRADAAGAVRIAGAMMLIYLARGALNYLNFYLFARSSQTIVYQVSRDMFVRLVRHSMRFFESQRTGETVSHLTADVTAVQQAMQGQVLTASAGIVTMLLYLVVMLTLDWRLTLVILSVVPLMLIASVITARMLRVRYRRVQESIANINTAIEENVSGVRVSRAFAREEADARRFQTENRANLQANLNTTMVESIATPVIEGLSTLSVAALLAYGGWQITIGEMQPGTLIAFLAYVQIFHQPMTELVRVNYVIQSGLAAADRIFQFMDVPRHIVDQPSAVDLVQPRGRVEFRNVDFSYDGTTPVLQDISVTAEPGQTVALVGATGSGKTTMVNLIARFYDPTSGQILVDGNDLRDLRMESLRSRLAFVPQETFLFSGTIAENIRYGDPAAGDSQVAAAAALARADDFIAELDDGYETIVGDGGLRLSRGQQQRVALARAILADPAVLVLDEATSDIDTESEYEIQRALVQVMHNRTSFVIAHRLSTIRSADRIVVLDEGRIVQRGAHTDLIAQPGPYRDLHAAQFDDPPPPPHS